MKRKGRCCWAARCHRCHGCHANFASRFLLSQLPSVISEGHFPKLLNFRNFRNFQSYPRDNLKTLISKGRQSEHFQENRTIPGYCQCFESQRIISQLKVMRQLAGVLQRFHMQDLPAAFHLDCNSSINFFQRICQPFKSRSNHPKFKTKVES